MFTFSFGPNNALFSSTLPMMIPLILLTLAFILPRTAGIWNLGAQGQMTMGAIAATGVALSFPNWPPYILIPFMIIAATGLGAGWAFIPAFLKGRLHVNEILTTLLFNWISLLIVDHLVNGGIWTSKTGEAESDFITSSGVMPVIGNTRISYIVFVAIGLAILLFIVLKRSSIGFEIRAMGKNPKACEQMGMNFLKITIITMLIGGAIAGIAGYSQVANGVGKLRTDIAPNWGYYAVVIGLIANQNPIAAMVASFFISGFFVGTNILGSFLGSVSGSKELFMGILFLVFAGTRAIQNYINVHYGKEVVEK